MPDRATDSARFAEENRDKLQLGNGTICRVRPVKPIRKSALLRRAIEQGCVMMPGAFNAATARLVERAGFPAVYVSGAGLANATAGVPDIGLLTLTEVAQLAGYIADAVSIPALADADTGFGGQENEIGRAHV